MDLPDYVNNGSRLGAQHFRTPCFDRTFGSTVKVFVLIGIHNV